MDRLESLSDSFRFVVLNSLTPVITVDMLLTQMGASRSRPPADYLGRSADYLGRWVDHLAWGADSIVATARLLLCGQVVGAAAIARNQLERWTMHRAFNGEVIRRSGESATDYIARAWSTPDRFDPNSLAGEENNGEEVASLDEGAMLPGEPQPDHRHVRLSDGREVCPAVLYECLSEIMHGREFPSAIGWDGDALLGVNEPPDGAYAAAAVIADTISVCLRQIRTAIGGIAQVIGDGRAIHMLESTQDAFSKEEPDPPRNESNRADEPRGREEPEPVVPEPPLGTLVAPLLPCLMPLLPKEGLAPPIVALVDGMARTFDSVLHGGRPAGRLFRDDELLLYAFAWHRAAAMRTARAALEQERKDLGEAFNIDVLSGRATVWVLLTEATSLLGVWEKRPEPAAAAALVGSALRSTYWLWLEDDDRAMSVLRCVLEQCARLRVWRLKPSKATELERRAKTMPRDWLEAAGWRRLRALNRALGEFSHTQPSSRWTGARDLLADLQPGADPAKAIYTARGASIDFVAALVARELIDQITVLSSPLADALANLLEEIGVQAATDTNSLEGLFNHIWEYRSASFGDPVFSRPVQQRHHSAASTTSPQ